MQAGMPAVQSRASGTLALQSAMPTIPFCKFHGFGNDYIVIERDDVPGDLRLGELAKAICHRHIGAGSDGIAVIGPNAGGTADFFCEIVNPDGSVAGFSGNGTRCAVAYLNYKNIWTAPTLTLRTRSGEKRFERLNTDENGFVFRAEIGQPKFSPAEVPFLSEPGAAATGFPDDDRVVDYHLEVAGGPVSVSCVNVGNPVACIFVDEFPNDWRGIGRSLEVHSAFPARANIVFVKTIDRADIEIRIWERGAGETSASGTCSAGSAVLSAFTGRTDRHVKVHSPGGVNDVLWRDDDEILLTGRAELSYCGEWPLAQARP